MNNKGYTLVELLAVIVILALLAGIGVASINNSIKASREKSLELQYETIESTAKSFCQKHLLDSTRQTHCHLRRVGGGDRKVYPLRGKENGRTSCQTYLPSVTHRSKPRTDRCERVYLLGCRQTKPVGAHSRNYIPQFGRQDCQTRICRPCNRLYLSSGIARVRLRTSCQGSGGDKKADVTFGGRAGEQLPLQKRETENFSKVVGNTFVRDILDQGGEYNVQKRIFQPI